jgi:hypothetical protein
MCFPAVDTEAAYGMEFLLTRICWGSSCQSHIAIKSGTDISGIRMEEVAHGFGCMLLFWFALAVCEVKQPSCSAVCLPGHLRPFLQGLPNLRGSES